MFAAASPHAQILLAPWRQRRNGQSLLRIVLTQGLLPCAAIALVVATSLLGQVALKLGAGSLALLLQALWLTQFASLQRQNHPTAARLVPGHLQRLREAMLGLWLAIAVISAVLLGSVFGHGPAWGLASAALMLLTAVMMRHPLLWSVFWIVPVTERWWGRSAPWRWLRSEGVAWYADRPLLLCLSALLVLALLLGALLRAGGSGHALAYAKGERQRLALRQAALGGSMARYQGGIGAALARLFSAPYRAWMGRLLATAQPTPRSVLARAELAFGAGAHWTAQFFSAALFVVMGLLGAGALVAFDQADLGSMLESAKFGLTVGLTSWAVNPVISLRNSLYNRRREQALLMLVPGMPRGAALNRQLARRQLVQVLSAWLLTLGVVIALTSHGRPGDPFIGYALAGLPATLLLLRNWATLKAPGGSGASPLVMLLLLGGGALYAAVRWLEMPVWLLAAVVVSLTAAVGLWCWRQLARYPQAFPVGRLS